MMASVFLSIKNAIEFLNVMMEAMKLTAVRLLNLDFEVKKLLFAGSFQCGDGTVIWFSDKCNGVANCRDRSDESRCGKLFSKKTK